MVFFEKVGSWWAKPTKKLLCPPQKMPFAHQKNLKYYCL